MRAIRINTEPKDFLIFDKLMLERNIISRFKSIVAVRGSSCAVKDAKLNISFELLDEMSSAVAGYILAELGDKKEPLAMMYKHGGPCIVAQLGVLKTGKFYSNIDYELSQERQAATLENLGTRVLLCDSDCEKKAISLQSAFHELIIINTDNLPKQIDPLANPSVTIAASDIALIVYTSGSTGKSQGVMLSHQNVLATARTHGIDFQLNFRDKASQICPLWTVAGCSEVFTALLNGVCVYPFSISENGISAYIQLIIQEELTTLTASPILFRLIFGSAEQDQYFPSMRLIRLGGDRTTRTELELFRKHFGNCYLRLGYGSSEFAQATQIFLDRSYVAEEEVLPIGFPTEDCEVFILDDNHNHVGPHQQGEIAIRSRYLSCGYWNNSQLTKERFVSSADDHLFGKMYLTRDIGYMDANGCFHHLGRKDALVKIHGKSVITSDLEKALLGIPGIKEAVVLPFEYDKRCIELAAFVVGDCLHEIAALRTTLLSKIGISNMPKKIIMLEKMPLLKNNKVDRLNLRELLEKN